MNAVYTWRTHKIPGGVRFDVLRMDPRRTPNARGNYADTTIELSGVVATRAMATRRGQHWVRFLKASRS